MMVLIYILMWLVVILVFLWVLNLILARAFASFGWDDGIRQIVLGIVGLFLLIVGFAWLRSSGHLAAWF